MSDQAPIGKKYSQVYLLRGEPVQDSARFRARLNGYLSATFDWSATNRLAAKVLQSIGMYVPVSGNNYNFANYFAAAKLPDVLDTITVVHDFLIEQGRRSEAADWLRRVKLAIHEENLGYRIDSKGGMHPLVDVVFEAERVAVIQSLGGARYKATLNAFEGAHEAIERDPPDTKEAVRDVFSALENLFKLMSGGAASRLVKFEIDKHLPPMLDKKYPEPKARVAAGKMLDSFIDWVSAGHEYRHEPGTVEPLPPPMDYTVMTMSTGAGYLRWLAEIDRAVNAAVKP